MFKSAAFVLSFCLGGAVAAAPVSDSPRERWVTSWYAAPQAVWGSDFLLPLNVPAQLDHQTVRETVRISAGGHRLRLVLSNRYGREAVRIGPVRVGVTGAERPLTFAGQPIATIAPGAVVTSDPVELDVAPLALLTVRSHLPDRTPIRSFHWGGQQTLQITDGNTTTTAGTLPGSRAEGRLFLSAVLVEAAAGSHGVVAIGDSITDGNGSTADANRRWPDVLAARLAPHGIAVANAAISGGRLLTDGMGQSALARFDNDVLSQPGIADVIVLLGTNDIGWPGGPFAPAERPVTFDQLTAGLRQLLAAAHAHGVRMTVATVPPFERALEGTPFAGHYSESKEALRKQLNHWIRTAGLFDAVVDFDLVLRDPARPQRLRAAFDSGDHLHPNDAGYRAMAAAIDIAPLLRKGERGAVK
jgi:lysophospholipase L1-like esterase